MGRIRQVTILRCARLDGSTDVVQVHQCRPLVVRRGRGATGGSAWPWPTDAERNDLEVGEVDRGLRGSRELARSKSRDNAHVDAGEVHLHGSALNLRGATNDEGAKVHASQLSAPRGKPPKPSQQLSIGAHAPRAARARSGLAEVREALSSSTSSRAARHGSSPWCEC